MKGPLVPVNVCPSEVTGSLGILWNQLTPQHGPEMVKEGKQNERNLARIVELISERITFEETSTEPNDSSHRLGD